MSNYLLTDKWKKALPNFSSVLNSCEHIQELPAIRTFFGAYKNPIGIEVEMEGITKRFPRAPLFWSVTEDGSLRNSGREFISFPLSGRQIDYALYELSVLIRVQQDRSWSHRTSIHVHQNFSTLREKHLMGYVMLYALFEELFYSMAADYRAANPFCYKVCSTSPRAYAGIMENNKYCGLNLAPLKRQCTVEFRHMHGTEDLRLIRRWLQMIVKLHAWVERQKSTEIIGQVQQHIASGSFVVLAKEIWGVNSTLFDPQFVQSSAAQNAVWALCLSEKEFV